MAYIKLFFAVGDSQVSESPSQVNPVAFTLRADQNEEGAPIRLYAMADVGYSVANTTVTPTGSSAAKWQFAPDVTGTPGTWEAYGNPLSLGTVGNGAGKVYFHARAKATSDETPVNDTNVTINLAGVASAV